MLQQGNKEQQAIFVFMKLPKKTALAHKWPADSKAPFKQIGFVIVEFSVRQ